MLTWFSLYSGGGGFSVDIIVMMRDFIAFYMREFFRRATKIKFGVEILGRIVEASNVWRSTDCGRKKELTHTRFFHSIGISCYSADASTMFFFSIIC